MPKDKSKKLHARPGSSSRKKGVALLYIYNTAARPFCIDRFFLKRCVHAEADGERERENKDTW